MRDRYFHRKWPLALITGVLLVSSLGGHAYAFDQERFSVSGEGTALLAAAPGDGTSMATAVPFTLPGPLSATISASGYSWFRIDGLNVGQSVVATVTRSSGVSVYSILGSAVPSSCTGTTTRVCTFRATSATHYIRVFGLPAASVTLSAVDGSAAALAYGPVTVTDGTPTRYYLPAGKTGWFKASLPANGFYGVNSAGASRITVYESGQQIATAAGPWVTFTTGAAGEYAFEVTTSIAAPYGLTFHAAGTLQQTAYEFPLSGPLSSAFTRKGHSWYRLEGLQAGRTLELTATSATGVYFFNASGAAAGSCYGGSCRFRPAQSGLYFVKVTGPAGAPTTLTAVDGSEASRSYGPVALKESSPLLYHIPARTTGWFKANLPGGTLFGVKVAGASRVTVYSDGQEVAVADGPEVTFTTGAAGEYYFEVASTLAAAYGLTFQVQGTSQQTAEDFPLYGPISSAFTSKGYTWYRLEGLQVGRTFDLTAYSATRLTYYNAAGAVMGECIAASCRLRTTAAEDYFVRVTGPAGAPTTLAAVDGSDPTLAYGPVAVRESAPLLYYIPASATGWFKANLQAGSYYGVNVAGASQIAVYNEGEKVTEAAGDWVTFTSGAAGEYYFEVLAGRSAAYGLTFAAQGTVQATALDFPLYGPMNSTITSKGHSWYRLEGLQAGRTFELTAASARSLYFYNKNGAMLASCSGPTCRFRPVTGEVHAVKAAGTPGAVTKLTALDGSDLSLAYGPVAVTSGIPVKYDIPAAAAGWFKADLPAGRAYRVRAAGASKITVYSGGEELATAAGESVTFTTGAAGRYHFEVTASTAAAYGLIFTAP